MRKVVVRLVLSQEFTIFAKAKFGDGVSFFYDLGFINYNIILLCHYLELQ